MLDKRQIVLGVTGGIAAYKAVELLRLFVKEGADVWTIMTESAAKFVGPLTFQSLSGHPVSTDMFAQLQQMEIEHIALADRADIAVIAPATANIIGKMAMGIADDMLSTTWLAMKCPVIVCPAMNVNMYDHPAVRENLKVLKERGVLVVEPSEGELACGWRGKGRLADPPVILEAVKDALSPKDLIGEHILVTAGPTHEPIDPVRFISNHSTGKMGFAVARAAKRRGAKVTLVSGPTALAPPDGVRYTPVKTALEMHSAVLEYLDEATVVVKSAAVTDFRPVRAASNKIKRTDKDGAKKPTLSVELEENPDILMDVGKRKGNRVIVGFAAETDDLIKNAEAKLIRKNLDFIVANDLTEPGSGFGSDTNRVTMLFRDGTRQNVPQADKEVVAGVILDAALSFRKKAKDEAAS